jgi:hypothetical protein
VLLELEGDSHLSDLIPPSELQAWLKGKKIYNKTKDGTGHLTL